MYVSITVNGKKILLATKQWIAIKSCDPAKGFGKITTPEGREINAYLDGIRQSIRECYKELQIQRKIITAKLIKASFLGDGDNEQN